MSGLVDAPWSDGAAAPPQDEDLAARIGAMSIRDLKGFLAVKRDCYLSVDTRFSEGSFGAYVPSHAFALDCPSNRLGAF